MSEPVKPALTPSEWKALRFDTPSARFCAAPAEPNNPHCVSAWTDGDVVGTCDNCVVWGHGAVVNGEGRRGLAALCLYGQPFGFTQEDVINLRAEAYRIRTHLRRFDESAGSYELQELWDSLADRIAALLPPSEGTP